MFNKSFFKFALGFVAIVFISLGVIVITSYFSDIGVESETIIAD